MNEQAQLTQEEFDAIDAFRIAYEPISKKPGMKARGLGSWQKCLTEAWLHDWQDQRGILRSVRNRVGIQEALAQYKAMASK